MMLAITAQYTDWSLSSPHPLSRLRQTSEALHDATIVAPLIATATYLSGNERTTFLYVLHHLHHRLHKPEVGNLLFVFCNRII